MTRRLPTQQPQWNHVELSAPLQHSSPLQHSTSLVGEARTAAIGLPSPGPRPVIYHVVQRFSVTLCDVPGKEQSRADQLRADEEPRRRRVRSVFFSLSLSPFPVSVLSVTCAGVTLLRIPRMPPLKPDLCLRASSQAADV